MNSFFVFRPVFAWVAALIAAEQQTLLLRSAPSQNGVSLYVALGGGDG